MITFNIEQSPPTAEQIVAVRQHHAVTILSIVKRVQKIELSAVAVDLLSISSLVWLWFAGRFHGIDVVLLAGGLAVVIAFALSVALSLVGFLYARVAFGAFVVAGAFLGAGAGAFLGAGAGAFFGGMGGVLVSGLLFDKHIVTLHDNAIQCLANLEDLRCLAKQLEKQDECIQCDAWRDQDETIKLYFNALAAMKRKPVVAEYEAAKDWIETRDQRRTQHEKENKARAACERMEQVV